MTNPHDAFKSLAPIDWDSIDQDNLASFMGTTFSEAQEIIDSIPVSLAPKGGTQAGGRGRSSTDSAVPQLPERAPASSERAQQLRKEWKDVAVNPKENPLGVNVYRLNAKDKKGAWFARRSVHEGLSFEKWKLGMEREFAESLKVQGSPGDGKIRGIGADKRVVNTVVDGVGKIEVFALSAQFPGPTTPREFITLLMSSDCALEPPMLQGLGKPKYFMVVSKPCTHPECPPRTGYIRGQYESVEFIREIKVERPLRKVHSSVALGAEESEATRKALAEQQNQEDALRSESEVAIPSSTSNVGDDDGRRGSKTIARAGTEGDEDDGYDTLVEWLMVTRSDPGGSVPRFMVEKGTPGGIAGDAKKFLQWISAKNVDEFNEDDHVDAKMKDEAAAAAETEKATDNPTSNVISHPSAAPKPVSVYEDEDEPAPSGFYGMIANALVAAGSVVTSRLSSKGGDSDSDLSPSGLDSDLDSGDASSMHSFHSFGSDKEKGDGDVGPAKVDSPGLAAATPADEAPSTHSADSAAAGKSPAPSQHEKELRKLEERRRKAQEKADRAQERALAKKDQDAKSDEGAIAKLREKHEREVAKQEERYRRDLKRLEDKKAAEQKKAEERRRKAAEREQKDGLATEVAKLRAERDLANKQIEILKDQVGDLQAQNTVLAAKLGRQSPGALAEVKRSAGSSESLRL